MAALSVRHIQVKRDVLVLEVVAPLSTAFVAPQVAQRILSVMPNLAKHICENDHGDTFGDDIEGTEIAHLLEHVIIELQGKAYAEWGANRPLFTGRTSWSRSLAEARELGESLMTTTVTFVNDYVALQAIKDACFIIEWAHSGTQAAPDVQLLVNQLKQLI